MLAETRFKGFVGPSYNLNNINYDCQRLINRYVEYNEMGFGKDAEPAQLVPTPGLTRLITGLNGVSRGGYVASNGACYWVFGNVLYQINGNATSTGWTATTIGTIDCTADVQYTDNGLSLFIVSNTGMVWLVNLKTNVLTNVSTDPTWNATLWVTSNYTNPTTFLAPATSCTYMDGYVLFTLMGSNTFFWTDLYSTSITISNLANPSASGGYAAAEANPDLIVGIINNNEDLWIFGGTTTELWYDLGSGNNIFARRPGILVETGAASPNTIEKLNNTIFWMATDERGGPIVYMAQGYVPVRVSNYALEQKLAALTAAQVAAATADSYQLNGHFFYSLNVPGLSSTWVFDMTTYLQTQKAQWFEKQSGYGTQAARSIAEGQAYYLGKHITGDYTTGNLYFMDQSNSTENGYVIARTRITPHVSNSLKRVKHISLQIDYQPGTITDEAANPQVILQYSDDGGNTWSDERYCPLGRAGQYNQRVIFYRLGTSRNRVYKVTDVNNAYSGITGADLVLDLGST